MSFTKKPVGLAGPRKQAATSAGRVMSPPKKVAAKKAAAPSMPEMEEIRKMDRMLGRIERQGAVLLAKADRLLKRVS